MKRFFLFFFLVAIFSFAAEEQRIVAVGDIHGDLSGFQTILQAARILDANGNWIAGKTILVQTGDAIDRGVQSKQVLDLLMKLEAEAPKKGGRVHSLIGNHEAMNVMADLRYVPPKEFAQFATQNSDQRLKEAYETHKRFQLEKARKRQLPAPEFTPQMEEEWLKAHPRGFLEHREAYGPDGKYGQWIRKKNAVLELKGNIFAHGGIGPAVSPISANEINDRIRKELALFDKLQKNLVEQKIFLPFFTFNEMIDAAKQELGIRKKDETLQAFLGLGNWMSVSPQGPLWFRGYAQWTEEEIAASLPPLLKSYNAKRFIVGHTFTKNGEIQSRQNHTAIMIDTGMNRASYPEGQASALEIKGQTLTAIYSEKTVVLNP